jgi:uncharacterized protein (DUF427 family)
LRNIVRAAGGTWSDNRRKPLIKDFIMPTARWNGAVIAEAPDDAVEIVEGNVYFPMQAVHPQYLRASSKTTTCHWKGLANYFDVIVDGEVNQDAAWTYREPAAAAKQIAGFIAFWRGVQVER